MCGSARLLDDMSQFMGQDAPADRRIRGVVGCAEDDIVSDGIGDRMDLLRGIRGALVRMHSHGTEIVSESRLEKGPSLAIQRLAGRSKDIFDGRWHVINGRGRRKSLYLTLSFT